MWKVRTALLLFVAFILYSLLVYSNATEVEAKEIGASAEVMKGKQLYERNNCVSCHQVYGLGGYLGPDLTRVHERYPDGAYIKAMLMVGNKNMPVYKLTEEEMNALLAYFKYLNQYPAYGQK